MKLKIVFLYILFHHFSFSQSPEQNTKILEKSFERMMELQSVAYDSYKEAEESNVTYLTQKDFIYFDLKSGSLLKTPRYYLGTDEDKLLYDGKRQLLSSKKKQLVMVNDKPLVNNPLLLTFVPIRNFMAEVLTNDSTTVKLVDNKSSSNDFEFKITIHEGWFDWERRKITQKEGYKDSNYVLHLYADNLLPKRMTKENGPTGHLTRTFDHYRFDYTKSEDFWEGNELPDYKRVSLEEFFQTPEKETVDGNNSKQEPIGQDFELPVIGSNNTIKPFNITGQVVLLEFWFRNCGPCVKAVPSINMLHTKYGNKGLNIFGVEFIEGEASLNLLKAYKSKTNMLYPSLYMGGPLATSLNVQAGPTIVIIDKKGEIIYNQPGYDEEKVSSVLSNVLSLD
ncbi:TlpA disulfide reductase family protein [Muricauda sp. 334s03]|uniref:TlpA disulfide reductase family protein n=1 Tax=Flagellimonas yonaguniensis TaxID=3031325 RepID=A0ABT5XUK6_9FLAO|nr:TlpA disulfide reductase family protein [[Muricauda] yonaguniensis]MDF0714859.1 TlpA disulfide reductase family protein [[Muricauda] yonaguniensis]